MVQQSPMAYLLCENKGKVNFLINQRLSNLIGENEYKPATKFLTNQLNLGVFANFGIF